MAMPANNTTGGAHKLHGPKNYLHTQSILTHYNYKGRPPRIRRRKKKRGGDTLYMAQNLGNWK